MAALYYKLGAICLTPDAPSRLGMMVNTNWQWTSLANHSAMRMRSMPIAREQLDTPVYVRLSIMGRLIPRSFTTFPYAPEVLLRVMDGVRQLVQLYSNQYAPILSRTAHSIATNQAIVAPPSDDPSHGTDDVQFHLQYAIRQVTFPPQPTTAWDALEWSGVIVEFFTWP